MSRDWRQYLDDVQAYAAAAQRIVHGLTRDEVFGDERTRFAVLHALQVVGEAAKKVPPEVRARASHVPWAQITGFRDRIAHGYWALDEEVVWVVLQRDLEPLRAAAAALLAEADRADPQGRG